MRVLLIVYDNDSYIHHTPIGLAYLAGAIQRAGHEVEIYNQDLYHWPETHLTEYLKTHKFDVVGLSFVAGYYPYRKVLKIAAAINAVPKRPFFVLGGHGPSPEPAYFLKKTDADCVVIGEGEQAIVNLLNRRNISEVKGIAYLRDGKLVETGKQPLIEDINSIPIPPWHLFPMNYYALYRVGNVTQSSDRLALMLSGRGCPFHCNFCYRMDDGSRIRSPENIIEEIELFQKDYNINFILFQDELLMTSTERTEAICESFLKANLNIRWGCNGRLNYATPNLMHLMKESGCVFINYGIEAVDDDALRNMNKALNVRQITRGIEATLAEGIHPGFNIIFGNIGETREVLQKDVDFLLKYDDQGQMRTIRPVTPYPGSPLYYHALEHGLLKGAADFYENKHTNQDLLSVNFTDMSDDEFHRALYEANTTLLDNYHTKLKQRAMETCKELYLEKDVAFRGFRQT